MQKGFSLVELSIVLVILGLLTGGILAGQNLIRAAELRAVTTEYNRYVTAAQTFRDKYFALPGDMRNATQFWGRLNSGADCVTNSAAAVASPGACDGNGDGDVDHPTAASQAGEAYGFWGQLAAAGLIEGTYTGIAGSGAAGHTVPGENVPTAKISTAGWGVGDGSWSGHASFSDNYYRNHFQFGAAETIYGQFRGVLLPEEAWNIDTKMDDGLPQQGKIWAIRWNACTTATSSADLTGEYDLVVTTKSCALIFPEAF